MSVELHIRTRKALRPDPEFDAICAIFYNIEHEAKEGKKNITGVIVANNESTKLTRTETESKVSSNNDGKSTDDGVANGNSRVFQGTSVDGTSSSGHFGNSVLWRTGFADDLEIITVNEENDAITRFCPTRQSLGPRYFGWLRSADVVLGLPASAVDYFRH